MMNRSNSGLKNQAVNIGRKAEAVKSRLISIFEQQRLYLPMREALLLLAKKGIPVYFYNRVGFLKGYAYPAEVKRRMSARLTFPKMYQDPERYASDLKSIFGSKYSPEYVAEIGKIPQVVKKDSQFCHEDYSSRYVNVVDGCRVTAYQPSDYTRTLHIYGRCGVFGYAVEDSDTMPSQIQKYLSEHGIKDVRVVNHGLWGGEDNLIEHNFLEDVLGFGPSDIVVFYMRAFHGKMMREFISCGMRYKDITKKWHASQKSPDGCYDRPGHMNADGYAVAAKLVAQDLIRNSFAPGKVLLKTGTEFSASHLTKYLKKNVDRGFESEVKKYTEEILCDYPAGESIKRCGAIVMNCNPFTVGHRYLIEYAAERVDRLYIFVVEENKSVFDFQDRFEMVRAGTKDLANVVVVPSGKFVISAYTFPEYFMKDYVKERDIDISGDIRIFCKYIAPALSIHTRFAGEEPLDPVTARYNETMAEILPAYGMEFSAIPRMTLKDHGVVNATAVRKLLEEKKYEEIREFVPETTYNILMERYAD